MNKALRSIYLDPFANILDKQNVTVASADTKEVGVIDADPTVTTVLLIDFKNDGHKTWPILLDQLQSLRDRDGLTYCDSSALHQGPSTVVKTRNTSFELVRQNSSTRFVLFDALLLSISDEQHDTTDSYYVSVQMKKMTGLLWLDNLSTKQVDKLAEQIHGADARGLKSRY